MFKELLAGAISENTVEVGHAAVKGYEDYPTPELSVYQRVSRPARQALIYQTVLNVMARADGDDFPWYRVQVS